MAACQVAIGGAPQLEGVVGRGQLLGRIPVGSTPTSHGPCPPGALGQTLLTVAPGACGPQRPTVGGL